MKNNTETTKDQTTKTPKTSKAKRQPAKVAKEPQVESETEPVDRVPASLEELKASKGGLVTFLFLSGKEKEDVAKELKTAFKLTDDQAGKIVRRITGRARFFRRAFDLMAAK
ncbi:MAG: hypothetical protein ACYDC1_12485 [Limisphaerales bacterium]